MWIYLIYSNMLKSKLVSQVSNVCKVIYEALYPSIQVHVLPTVLFIS